MAVPFAELAAALRAGRAVVAGVLSGTSCDGIDVALARFEARPSGLGRPRLLAFEVAPYPPELAARARSLVGGAPHAPRDIALFARDFGAHAGRAARALARRAGLALDLVGGHGQTVWHHDGVDPAGRASLQLGDGDALAEAAECSAVSDFRQRDLAAGGEGAPILALVDELLFPELERPAAVLNLGGIANLALLVERGAPPRSFDVGPANALLDGLARRLLGRECDRDGAAARSGRVDERLAARILAHPFYDRAPPKSTGRDTFGEAWLDGLLAGAGGLPANDVLATATMAIARSIAEALERQGSPLRRLVVAGGGALNPALMAALARALAIPVESSGAHGVDPKAREALGFAALAAAAVLGIATSAPSATGAAAGRVLGKLSPWWGSEAARPGAANGSRARGAG